MNIRIIQAFNKLKIVNEAIKYLIIILFTTYSLSLLKLNGEKLNFTYY